MLISDVSLNDASVCTEINRRVDQRCFVYETELYVCVLTLSRLHADIYLFYLASPGFLAGMPQQREPIIAVP